MFRKKWITRETAAEALAMRAAPFATLCSSPMSACPSSTTISRPSSPNSLQPTASCPSPSCAVSKSPPPRSPRLSARISSASKSAPADFHLTHLHAFATPEHELNPAQLDALDTITIAAASKEFRPLLLHGVTGSGKTAVYLAAMRRTLDAGRTTILLVPEIGLTPAMAAQLHHAFGSEVALLHSALTPEERGEQLHRIRKGEARVVVGTRSAIFAPVGESRPRHRR